MSEAVLVEEARRADLEAIVAILASDRVFGQRDSAEAADLPDYERAFVAMAATPNLTLYVARKGRVVLGTFQLVFFHALLRHGRLLAIAEAVHVHPEARGSGIGSAMMEFAVAEAKRRGAGSLQLVSNKLRLDAHRFYERMGFEKRLDGFKIDLSGRG
ncbi:MAG TPA: GNAT family N-acetyltransferase [Ancylobacter sp.]